MKYNWNRLTEEEEIHIIHNLLIRSHNLRSYAPKENLDTKKMYENNADVIDIIIKKLEDEEK